MHVLACCCHPPSRRQRQVRPPQQNSARQAFSTSPRNPSSENNHQPPRGHAKLQWIGPIIVAVNPLHPIGHAPGRVCVCLHLPASSTPHACVYYPYIPLMCVACTELLNGELCCDGKQQYLPRSRLCVRTLCGKSLGVPTTTGQVLRLGVHDSMKWGPVLNNQGYVTFAAHAAAQTS